MRRSRYIIRKHKYLRAQTAPNDVAETGAETAAAQMAKYTADKPATRMRSAA